MYIGKFFVPIILTLFLAACGGNGVTPTPAPNPIPAPGAGSPTTPPDTTPVNPAPTPTPTPGNGNVPYYGEWEVTFTTDSGVSFVHSLNVTDAITGTDLQNGAGGLQRLCIGEGSNPCDDNSPYASGFGFIGNLPLDDGTTPLVIALFTQYFDEDPELKILSAESMTSTTNSQGQTTLSGDGIWLYQANVSNDGSSGRISAVNVGAPQTLRGVTPKSLRVLAQDAKRFLK